MNDCYKNICSKKDARLYFRYLSHGSLHGKLSLSKLKSVLSKLGYIEVYGEERYLELKKQNTQDVEEEVRVYLEKELEEIGSLKVWWAEFDLLREAKSLVDTIVSISFALALLYILTNRFF